MKSEEEFATPPNELCLSQLVDLGNRIRLSMACVNGMMENFTPAEVARVENYVANMHNAKADGDASFDPDNDAFMALIEAFCTRNEWQDVTYEESGYTIAFENNSGDQWTFRQTAGITPAKLHEAMSILRDYVQNGFIQKLRLHP